MRGAHMVGMQAASLLLGTDAAILDRLAISRDQLAEDDRREASAAWRARMRIDWARTDPEGSPAARHNLLVRVAL